MEYIYDIILNFQNEYYDFYEWLPTDNIINVKKIPIYKISYRDYLNIRNNEVTIEKNTLPKTNKMFLLTSGIEIIGIIIDNKGKVIKKSSLLFEEADDILEDKDELKVINIKYIINKRNNNKNISRINKEKKKYVDNYFKRIDKIKNKYNLKYLYYDIYNIDEDNVDKIYNILIELSKKDINKMYEYIKKIELELNN